MPFKTQLAIGLLVLFAGLPLFAQSPAPAPTRAKDFDKTWAPFFGTEHFAYMAVADPNLDGPLMHRPLDVSSPAGQAAKGANPTGFLADFIEEAKKEKLIEKSLTELTPEGFALGAAPGVDVQKEPAMLFVAPKNPQLEKFIPWVVERYKKKHGADSVKDVSVEGLKGVQLLKSGNTKPVLVLSDKVLLVSNQEPQIANALKRAKDAKDSLGEAKFYQRGRARVGADAAVFAIIDPKPLIDALEKTSTGPGAEQQKAKMAEAKKNFEAIDSLLVQVSAHKDVSHVDLSVLLDPKAPSYEKFKSMATSKGVRSQSFVSADVPAFLNLIRPKDVFATVPAANKAQLEQQLQTLKGQLQVFTGLEFDTDVAPWWGLEIALGLFIPEGAPPEGALIFETTDAKKSQDALDKVVRHVKVSQNREFTEETVEGVVVKTAGQGPQGPQPVNPSVAAAKEFVILGTGPNIVKSILSSKTKLSSVPGFGKLAAAVPVERLGFTLYLKTDVLVKATQNPAGGAPPPNSPNAQFQKLASEVEAVLVGLGWPDDESVRLTVLFDGR
jgi:hypothetical protein